MLKFSVAPKACLPNSFKTPDRDGWATAKSRVFGSSPTTRVPHWFFWILKTRC